MQRGSTTGQRFVEGGGLGYGKSVNRSTETTDDIDVREWRRKNETMKKWITVGNDLVGHRQMYKKSYFQSLRQFRNPNVRYGYHMEKVGGGRGEDRVFGSRELPLNPERERERE